MINESISTLRILHLILIYISQQKDVRSILGIVVTLYSKVCCQLKTYLISIMTSVLEIFFHIYQLY